MSTPLLPIAAGGATALACARLVASRGQLRLAMRGPVTAAAEDGAPPPTRWTGLLALPPVRLLLDALRGWWAQHPWHAAGQAAAVAVDGALRPLARRHPWALVAAALLAGGLVAAVRPWRWRARAMAGDAGAWSRMAAELMGSLPIASWLVALAALAKAMAPAAATTGPANAPVASAVPAGPDDGHA